MRVVATFLDIDGKGFMSKPFEAVDVEGIHLIVFEMLALSDRALSFVLALELNPLRIVAHRASLNMWQPTQQQKKELLERITSEEMERIAR